MSRARSTRHSTTVEIAGEKHVIRSDAAPEYTRAVAAHVDHIIRALPASKPIEPHRTAILAAIVITDELFRARDELRRLREELASRAVDAAERLEWALSEANAPLSAPSPPDLPPDAAAPPPPV